MKNPTKATLAVLALAALTGQALAQQGLDEPFQKPFRFRKMTGLWCRSSRFHDSSSTTSSSVPTPPVEAKPLAPPPYRNPGAVAAPASPKPVSPPAAEPSKPGFWASILARLRGAYPPKKEN